MGAALHRTWLNVRDALAGRDDDQMVAEGERGEKVAVDNYQNVLKDAANLPGDVLGVVRVQQAKVQESQPQITGMKGGMQAA